MFRTEVWITAALITAGIVGGLICNWPRSMGEPNRESPTVIEDEEPVIATDEGKPLTSQISQISTNDNVPDAISVSMDVDQIGKGDQYLLVGNFDAAERAYSKAINKAQGGVPGTLLIRLAMTAEQIGDFRQADLLYQKAVRRSADGSMLRLLSLTGVARAWQQIGQLDQTKELLSELYLRYAFNETLEEEIRLQITYQLSSAHQLQCLQDLEEPEDSTDSIESKWCGPSIDAMIDILQTFGNVAEQAQPIRPPEELPIFRILQRPTADVNLISVDTVTPLISIEGILSQYATLAQLKFDLSFRASNVLAGRSARVEATGIPIAIVLDQMLSPLGLVWTQEEDRIVIQEVNESGIDRIAYQLNLTNRLLRNIELSFPREPRRDASLLHSGNLSLLGDDYVSARERYAELSKLAPNDELSAKLSFNTAIIDIAENKTEDAIGRLYYVVDQSLNHVLQAKCYAWIARLELQRGRSDRAVYASSRGLSLAFDQQVRQDLLMNLAKAHLLESDPFSANRVLFNHADAVRTPAAQRLAAVLSAYSRFLGMTPGDGLRDEGERMVIALASIRDSDTVSFVDRLLVGRAFFEVGFANRSIELLKLAIDQAPHDIWKQRVAFELATHQYRSRDLESADAAFQTVIGGPDSETALKAQFKLAEISLANKQAERCLEICLRLWQLNLDESYKLKTLSLMGQSYQRLGRHQIAAVCFSGMLPHEFQDTRKAGNENSGDPVSQHSTPQTLN